MLTSPLCDSCSRALSKPLLSKLFKSLKSQSLLPKMPKKPLKSQLSSSSPSTTNTGSLLLSKMSSAMAGADITTIIVAISAAPVRTKRKRLIDATSLPWGRRRCLASPQLVVGRGLCLVLMGKEGAPPICHVITNQYYTQGQKFTCFSALLVRFDNK